VVDLFFAIAAKFGAKVCCLASQLRPPSQNPSAHRV
jgi:hypothetical protein